MIYSNPLPLHSTKSGHSAALTDLGDKTITASLSYIPAEDLSPSPFRYKLRKECHCLPSLRQEQVDSLAGSEDRIAADPLTTDSFSSQETWTRANTCILSL